MAARAETITSVIQTPEKPKAQVTLAPVIQSIETRHNWLKWLNDPDINKWMYSDKPYTLEEVYRWIDRVVSDPKRHYFSIVVEGKPIGFVSLREDHKPSNTAEIGIVIGEKEQQSRGIGSQTINQVLEYAKNETSITSIRANIKPNNEKSIRLFTSAGFTFSQDISVEGVTFKKFEKSL